MKTIVDLHMHSHYSQATSKHLNLEGIAKFGTMKGVDVISAGDITHPLWLSEIASKLEEDGSGFLRMREGAHRDTIQFTLFGEIASIYRKDGVGRRIHTLFGVSSITAAKKVQQELIQRGFNISYDGRPIIGIDVVELMKIFLDVDPKALVIPAHIWTPWYALFGSKSGFDSIEDCFGDMSEYVYGIETGLSSDPAMNWQVSNLANRTILSNSDAHSPGKIGREANVFDWQERTYDALYNSIKENQNLEYTIEFYPEEGKYHLDGHRKCNIVMTPEETAEHNSMCPVCGKPLVVGVLNRINQLSDQTIETTTHKQVPFKSIVPLPEIIASCFGCGVQTKRVETEYEKLIEAIGNEFFILLEADMQQIENVADPLVAEGIRRVRDGELNIEPGYDGVFGIIEVFTDKERTQFQPKQKSLF